MNKQSLASQGPGKKYFIYTGNAYPHKNLGRLIEALVLLNNSGDEKVRLKIISARKTFLDRLEKLISSAKAKDYIEILEYIEDDKLAILYRNSIAFVFPTLVEGFGLPPMEAINAGTLALVSDISVLKEVYADSVFYFDPMDINSIKQSLDEVLNLNDKERKLKIEKSQEFLKRYSWSKMAKETLKIYESVV